MKVTFTDSQIILTHLVPGIYPEYTAASFSSLSGLGPSANVTVASSSSPLFAPGSVISFTGKSLLVNLSNTCDACAGLTSTSPGESIVLDVTAVPEPSTYAFMGAGLLALAMRRRYRRNS